MVMDGAHSTIRPINSYTNIRTSYLSFRDAHYCYRIAMNTCSIASAMWHTLTEDRTITQTPTIL